MVLLISQESAQYELVARMRAVRLSKAMTQQDLAARAGVSLATLRKFEHTGKLSLKSFLKLAIILDRLAGVLQAFSVQPVAFKSSDDVFAANTIKQRQRGRST